jgi:glycosyltransferase involved in cell wall biosynthesis
VAFAGGVAPHKGASTLIEAMRLLTERGEQDVHLTIVGHGHPAHRASLKEMVDRHALTERVHFQPAIPRREMPGLLQQSDALVLPTLSEEPLSRLVMEAMACGLVVLATHTGGTPEMIDHGVDGLLFAPGDSETLARYLTMVAKTPEIGAALAIAARRKAERQFRVERMVDEIEGFLRATVQCASCF